MGMHVSAKLIYGYHLKNDDQGWLVREVHDEGSDEYGLKLDWLGEDDDFQSKAEDLLLAAAGFEDVGYDEDPDGWRTRSKEARARVAAVFVIGGYQYSDLFLAADQHRADIGETTEIDPANLLASAGDAADEELRSALELLGLTPVQEKPAWLLTACYG